MATLANRETYSALGKGLGACAAMGTCFCILDTIRNPSAGTFMSVCIFGSAAWALLAGAVKVKRPSFATSAPEHASETIVGWELGAPSWSRALVWIGLFLVMLVLVAEATLNRSRLHISANGAKLFSTAAFGIYLLGCQRLERFVRLHLRGRYPDKPQVSISATGLWITGTEIPWGSIQGLTRRKRSLKVIGVETILVRARNSKRSEDIEIDLSDSVEDPDLLYAKLRSAAAAHGVQLQLPRRESAAATRKRVAATREQARASLAKAEQWRAGLGEGMAKTEAQLEDVKSRIVQTENRIAELKAALSKEDCPLEQTQKQLELTQASLRTMLGLREATERLLATQRKAYEKRL